MTKDICYLFIINREDNRDKKRTETLNVETDNEKKIYKEEAQKTIKEGVERQTNKNKNKTIKGKISESYQK